MSQTIVSPYELASSASGPRGDFVRLRALLNAKESVLHSVEHLSADFSTATQFLREWACGESEDIADAVGVSSTLLDQYSSALEQFSKNIAEVCSHLSNIRPFEDILQNLHRRRDSLTVQVDSARDELQRMTPGFNDALEQTDKWRRLQQELDGLDLQIGDEEADFSEFKRSTARLWMEKLLNGLVECSVKGKIVGDSGIKAVQEISSEPPSASNPYRGYGNTEAIFKEAERRLSDWKSALVERIPEPPPSPLIASSDEPPASVTSPPNGYGEAEYPVSPDGSTSREVPEPNTSNLVWQGESESPSPAQLPGSHEIRRAATFALTGESEPQSSAHVPPSDDLRRVVTLQPIRETDPVPAPPAPVHTQSYPRRKKTHHASRRNTEPNPMSTRIGGVGSSSDRNSLTRDQSFYRSVPGHYGEQQGLPRMSTGSFNSPLAIDDTSRRVYTRAIPPQLTPGGGNSPTSIPSGSILGGVSPIRNASVGSASTLSWSDPLTPVRRSDPDKPVDIHMPQRTSTLQPSTMGLPQIPSSLSGSSQTTNGFSESPTSMRNVSVNNPMPWVATVAGQGTMSADQQMQQQPFSQPSTQPFNPTMSHDGRSMSLPLPGTQPLPGKFSHMRSPTDPVLSPTPAATGNPINSTTSSQPSSVPAMAQTASRTLNLGLPSPGFPSMPSFNLPTMPNLNGAPASQPLLPSWTQPTNDATLNDPGPDVAHPRLQSAGEILDFIKKVFSAADSIVRFSTSIVKCILCPCF
ncbi:hypothetical protein JAAARDRAFT_209648 [Jaapia argillacea MUCL 33604]|uniref:Uncharacterized protein n=1 Tax=Jaapia argillacea MUCL 33604 TaxID=933084 RepID=A0A067PJ48_9AGAM|nr:hypothetical protein JAAARDRAFT_209648 [Jaapia argillacea MUCL 33604]